MYFIISLTAVNTIAKASNVITSTIYQYTPPFYKGAETAASVTLDPIRADSLIYFKFFMPEYSLLQAINFY